VSDFDERMWIGFAQAVVEAAKNGESMHFGDKPQAMATFARQWLETRAEIEDVRATLARGLAGEDRKNATAKALASFAVSHIETLTEERDEARAIVDTVKASLDYDLRVNSSPIDANMRAWKIVAGLTTTDAAIDRIASQVAELMDERDVLRAQLDAANAAISAECVEHVELNGHIDNATFAHDYLLGERDKGDPSGRLHDFVASLEVVIDQCDKQRRRANWYEAAHTAGKAKLIEHAVAKALDRARPAAHVYAERVNALGLAADDNDPLVMATAAPIGAAQADLFVALGLITRDEAGKVGVVAPAETVEQLRAERDTARALAEVRARDIPEQIAAWLDDPTNGRRATALTVADIRAGAWRKEPA
jgi:hypothetical protein